MKAPRVLGKEVSRKRGDLAFCVFSEGKKGGKSKGKMLGRHNRPGARALRYKKIVMDQESKRKIL